MEEPCHYVLFSHQRHFNWVLASFIPYWRRHHATQLKILPGSKFPACRHPYLHHSCQTFWVTGGSAQITTNYILSVPVKIWQFSWITTQQLCDEYSANAKQIGLTDLAEIDYVLSPDKGVGLLQKNLTLKTLVYWSPSQHWSQGNSSWNGNY